MRDIFVLFYHPPPSCLYSRRGSERLSAHSYYYTIYYSLLYTASLCVCMLSVLFFSPLFFYIYIHSNASNIFCFFLFWYMRPLCIPFCPIHSFHLPPPLDQKHKREKKKKKRKFQIPFSYTRAQR